MSRCGALRNRGLAYEIRLAELKLSLQQLYRHPAREMSKRRCERILRGLSLHCCAWRGMTRELNQVVALAEQFGEPSVLAETFEQLHCPCGTKADERKSRWLVFAAKQRMAAAQPRLAARNLCKAFVLERAREEKGK